MSTTHALVAVLSDPVRLLLLGDPGDGDIHVGGKAFVDAGLGKSIGFYDWLRRSSGEIIGVRTSFVRDSGVADFRHPLTSSPAIEWHQNELRLFFSTDREFDPKKSDDQELGIHRLAISSDGVALLTYDLQLLSPDEMSQISRWVHSV
jgi:hypothetical protein